MVVNMKRFALISEEERIVLTQRAGTYLTVRSFGHFFIELYAVQNFFVELWYNMKNSSEKMVKTRMFKDSTHLEVYLNDEVSFGLLQWVG
jgi:hypothetical protein